MTAKTTNCHDNSVCPYFRIFCIFAFSWLIYIIFNVIFNTSIRLVN